MKIGFTIGKFAPFHKGHEFLIETALNEVDELIVVVYDTPKFGYDIDMKTKWIQDRFPNVKIVKAYNSPSKYGLDEESVKIQMDYLEKQIGDIKPDVFFSSELYGNKVAKWMGIEHRMVDIERIHVPIGAEKIRKDLEANKKYLNDKVYKDLNACIDKRSKKLYKVINDALLDTM